MLLFLLRGRLPLNYIHISDFKFLFVEFISAEGFVTNIFCNFQNY